MTPLLGLAEAQERLLALARATAVQTMPIERAIGHYLAEPLFALRTQPTHPLSAMDGWAVRMADMPGPWKIVGESAAGHPFPDRVETGQAVRISTGAIVPQGADMVVVQEDCVRAGDALSFAGEAPVPLDRHVRRRGLDFAEGSEVLPKGAQITARSMALAIAAGHASASVRRPPQICVIDSGDELVPAGRPLADGQIPATNGPMIAAILSALPCKVRRIGPVGDCLDDLAEALDVTRDADLVITTGGASVGDHDLMRPALEHVGAQIDFWRVAIKPGKPILVAKRDKTIFLGLPGNPVSAFVTATLFALPLVRTMLGAKNPLPRYEKNPCAMALPATGKRAEFLRACIAGSGLETVKTQDSGALSPLALADALIVREANSPATQPGELVEYLRI